VAGSVTDPAGAALARQIVRLPEVVEDSAAAEATHAVTAYAIELATQFHAYYRDARVVDPDLEAILAEVRA
jgi:arginyl-tRNA synthetase